MTKPDISPWPDRVTLGITPNATNARPYLDGRRVYGAYDGSQSEGWIDAIELEPDNFTEGATGKAGLRSPIKIRLRGHVEFRTVNPDGSWPD